MSIWDELKENINSISESVDQINRIQESTSHIDDEVSSVIEILDKVNKEDQDDVVESIKEAVSILSDVRKALY